MFRRYAFRWIQTFVIVCYRPQSFKLELARTVVGLLHLESSYTLLRAMTAIGFAEGKLHGYANDSFGLESSPVQYIIELPQCTHSDGNNLVSSFVKEGPVQRDVKNRPIGTVKPETWAS
ncbi:MAG: hypothetical protein ACI8W7_004530 [Gammaproteobacteria bacterium]|jgi:hypothetical protein